MILGVVKSVDTSEDKCSVILPNGKEILCYYFTDKVPSPGDRALVAKDEATQLNLVIAIKRDFADKSKTFNFKPYSRIPSKLTETTDKLPGDYSLITESGAGLSIYSSGAVVLKANIDNAILLGKETTKIDTKNFSLVNPYGSLSFTPEGFALEGSKEFTKYDLGLQEFYATERLYISNGIYFLRTKVNSTNNYTQLKFEINSDAEFLAEHRDYTTVRQNYAKYEITKNKDLILEVVPDDTVTSNKRTLYLRIKNSDGSIKLYVGDQGSSNESYIEITQDLKLNINVKSDIIINGHANQNITIEGTTNIVSNGGVNIDGGSGSLSGVVTQQCICPFTGSPHSDYSGNVTASK